MTAQPHKIRNATSRLNPWLLLWLVPWLFLSVASGGLHDHGGALHQEKPCLQADATPGSDKNATPVYAQSAVHNTAHHDCLACRWSAQSALALSFSPNPSMLVSKPVLAQPQTINVPLSLALPALRGRGPPLV